MGLFLGNLSDKCDSKYEELEYKNKQILHDIKSPMTALSIGIHRIEKIIGPNDEGLALVKLAAERIKSLTDPLLNSSFSLKQSVLKTVFEFKNTFQKVDLEFETELETTIVNGDENQFLRILSNLLNNSIEANADKIRILATADANSVILKVIDNGIGFDQSTSHFIGHRGISLKKKNGGQGLGLSSAIEIISSWGGLIKFSSIPFETTVITIILKIHTSSN